jgi:hypothetical protein
MEKERRRRRESTDRGSKRNRGNNRRKREGGGEGENAEVRSERKGVRIIGEGWKMRKTKLKGERGVRRKNREEEGGKMQKEELTGKGWRIRENREEEKKEKEKRRNSWLRKRRGIIEEEGSERIRRKNKRRIRVALRSMRRRRSYYIQWKHNRMPVSVVEPHHFCAAPAPDKNFDAAPAPAPTLLYSMPSFWKQTKVNLSVCATLSSEFCTIEIVVNSKGHSKNCYSLWHC